MRRCCCSPRRASRWRSRPMCSASTAATSARMCSPTTCTISCEKSGYKQDQGAIAARAPGAGMFIETECTHAAPVRRGPCVPRACARRRFALRARSASARRARADTRQRPTPSSSTASSSSTTRAPAQALAVRDGKIAAIGSIGGHPRAGRPFDPRHRSRWPHRHPRPDRFAHPRHPRRPDLHHRGALDRRPHARRKRSIASARRPRPRRRDRWLVVAGGWTDRQFGEDRRPTQAEIAAAAPDHLRLRAAALQPRAARPRRSRALGIGRDEAR